MERFERFALILELVEKLRAAGSWCGETHIQKSAYFLEELLAVPLEFEFILYKHGPFSFQLREELTEMRASLFLRLEPRDPYGPSLLPAERSRSLKLRFAPTTNNFRDKINFVAEKVGGRSVSQLEKLATALYVSKRFKDQKVDLASEMLRLKSHLNQHDADWALHELGSINEAAAEL